MTLCHLNQPHNRHILYRTFELINISFRITQIVIFGAHVFNAHGPWAVMAITVDLEFALSASR